MEIRYDTCIHVLKWIGDKRLLHMTIPSKKR